MSAEAPSIWLTTLGCAKNQVDSDKIAAQLDAAGYRRAEAVDEADLVMVNTCAFIEEARRESIDTILAASDRKRSDAGIVVVGCMAQRYRSELADALPEVDAVVPLENYAALTDELDRLTGWQPVRFTSSPMDILFDTRRPTPVSPFAYVKVAEGCDKKCTFCAIPTFRGAQRSRPLANIRTEVEHLVAGDVGEIVLVAQDLAAYGRDLGREGIVDLLESLERIDGVRRIRLLYLYPREISDRLIDRMTAGGPVVPYFDLSLQHVSATLLRRMARPGSGAKHLELIERIRERDPDAALRSSFIVGFPGETDEQVEEMEHFLERAGLDWAGFFAFSPEDDTPAAKLGSRIPADVVSARMRHLQRVQDRITEERSARMVGNTVEVVVDTVEGGTPVARSYREAPEIDGVILLDEGSPGDWLEATVVGAYGQELAAEVLR